MTKSKKFFFLFIAILSFAILEAKQIEGKIITADASYNVGFDISLFLNKIDYQNLEKGIYYTDASDKKEFLAPDENITIEFEHNAETVRLASVTGYKPNVYTGESYIFLKVEVEGDVTMYSAYNGMTRSVYQANYSNTGFDNRVFNTSRFYVLEKPDGTFFTIEYRAKNAKFKRRMAWFVEDCPMLQNRIKKNEFKSKDLVKLIEIYNTECSN